MIAARRTWLAALAATRNSGGFETRSASRNPPPVDEVLDFGDLGNLLPTTTVQR